MSNKEKNKQKNKQKDDRLLEKPPKYWGEKKKKNAGWLQTLKRRLYTALICDGTVR